MTTQVSCPYCNTTFAPDAVLPGRRLECPRCGETFAHRSADDTAEAPAVGPAPGRPLPALQPTASPPTRRRTLLWGVGLALGLGVAGLGIGLYVAKHLETAAPPPPPESSPNAAATPPTELAGLGYLPADCNLVAAVQPGPMLAYSERRGLPAREFPSRAGVPPSVLLFVRNAGLQVAQIDHLVAGTMLADGAGEIRLAIVLVLRRPPADEETFLRAMDAKKDPRGKPRHNVTLDLGAKVPLALVRVSPTVWVFGWSDADLAPAEKGGGGLSPAFRDMIGTRLSPDTSMWVAADTGKWADKPLVKLAADWAGAKNVLPLLAKSQAGVAGLSFGESPRTRVFVRCVDEPTGAQLRMYFESKTGPNGHTGGAGEWALYDAPLDPQAGVPQVKQFLADAAR
jgi:hypothetical protein